MVESGGARIGDEGEIVITTRNVIEGDAVYERVLSSE